MRASRRLTTFLVLALSACAPLATAEEDFNTPRDPAVIQKSKKGLNFWAPEDWPVEERGGLVDTIPVEEYLSMKFKAFDSRLQSIEQRLQALDIRLRLLEQNNQPKPIRLKSSEEPKP